MSAHQREANIGGEAAVRVKEGGLASGVTSLGCSSLADVQELESTDEAEAV